MTTELTRKERLLQWLCIALLLPLFFMLIPAIVIWLLCLFVFRLVILALVWILWSTRGISMLVIYSNSPYWQRYFEDGCLPLIDKRSEVLNWSERSKWDKSFKTLVFSVFQGHYDFNPMIIFFRPFRRPKELRYHQAFHDAKHGKTKKLQELEKELSRLIDQPLDLEHLYPRKKA